MAIFTPNATGALRLVGEAYPFRAGDRFLLTFDNHNSVNGIREFARARGAETTYVPSAAPELRVDESLLPRYLARGRRRRTTTCSPIRRSRTSPASSIRSSGSSRRTSTAGTCSSTRPRSCRRTGSTSSRWHPDFVADLVLQAVRLADRRRRACSRGARRSRKLRAAVVLRRHDRRRVRAARLAPVGARRRALRGRHRQLPQPPRRRDRAALPRADRDRDRSTRASRRSASYLLETLAALRHSNGAPAATVYGPRDWHRRGATIAFNFLHPDGRVVDERYVDRVAQKHRISLRTGCFCNPGAGEVAFTISRETLVGGEFGDGMTLDDYVEAIGLPSGGAVRASLGLASNFADLRRFAAFAARVHRSRRRPRRPPAAHRLLIVFAESSK